MLDVTRLRVLDALARLGSVTAAAKELHYTQPTVSHHLARLEAETGAQLLQRPARGRGVDRQASRPADRPDRRPTTRGTRTAAHRQDRRRPHLSLRRDGSRA